MTPDPKAETKGLGFITTMKNLTFNPHAKNTLNKHKTIRMFKKILNLKKSADLTCKRINMECNSMLTLSTH
jgi:hypothetical protein